MVTVSLSSIFPALGMRDAEGAGRIARHVARPLASLQLLNQCHERFG